jgi:hypothetical protein
MEMTTISAAISKRQARPFQTEFRLLISIVLSPMLLTDSIRVLFLGKHRPSAISIKIHCNSCNWYISIKNGDQSQIPSRCCLLWSTGFWRSITIWLNYGARRSSNQDLNGTRTSCMGLKLGKWYWLHLHTYNWNRDTNLSPLSPRNYPRAPIPYITPCWIISIRNFLYGC